MVLCLGALLLHASRNRAARPAIVVAAMAEKFGLVVVK